MNSKLFPLLSIYPFAKFADDYGLTHAVISHPNE